MNRGTKNGGLIPSVILPLAMIGSSMTIEATEPPQFVFAIDRDPTQGELWMSPVGSGLFVASSPEQVYFTRGTPGSTHQVQLPAPVGNNEWLRESVPLGDVLIARASGPSSGSADFVFRSDGTAAGTFLLYQGVFPGNARVMFVRGEYVYFSTDGQNGWWRTDGTLAGTVQLPAQFSSLRPVIGGVLGARHAGAVSWWLLRDGSSSFEPIVPNPLMIQSGVPGPAMLGDGMVYFERTAPTQHALWWSDGVSFRRDCTISSIQPEILLVDPGSRRIYYLSPSADVPRGPALWSYSPDSASVAQHSRLPSTSQCGLSRVAVNDHVVFSIQIVQNGQWRNRMWTSSTTGGYSGYLLDDASGSDTAGVVVASNGRAYFSEVDAEHGRELWSSDGTPSGTYLLTDLRPGPRSGVSSCCAMRSVNSRVYFAGTDGLHGHGIWMLDTRPGDFDNDGRVNVGDVLNFVGSYLAGEDRADANHDGALDVADIYGWLGGYFLTE